VLDPIAKLYLHKDEDLPSVSADQDPARSALARLKERVPELSRRSDSLSVGSLVGGVVAVAGGVWYLVNLPGNGIAHWHHVLYPASLDSAFPAGADSLIRTMVSFFSGDLGVALSVGFLLIGIALGAARNSLAPVLAAMVTASLLHFGPFILLNVLDPGAGTVSPSASVRHLSVPELEKLRSRYAHSKELLPLTWVLAQKAYFGTRTAQFPQEVALLDKAYFARSANLPESATTARLLALSRAAHLPAEAAALQRERKQAQQRHAISRYIGRTLAETGGAFVLLFGTLAFVLQRRAVRITRKIAN
jgi:hypothetical protein